jgi:hypothetical protein
MARYHDFAVKNSNLEPSDYRAQARITAGRTCVEVVAQNRKRSHAQTSTPPN